MERELAENATFGEDLEIIKEIDINLLEKELDIKFTSEIKQKNKQRLITNTMLV